MRLSRLDSTHDCRSVEVIVGESGATLAFVTADGRGAARALETPADLAPALEALLVTLAPQPSAPAPRVAPAHVGWGPSPLPPADPAPPARRELRLLLGASAGGHLGLGATTQLSPAFALRAGVVVERWELGLAADVAPYHRPLGATAPEGFSLWTFAPAVTFGRREQVGGGALGYGVSVAAQILSQEGTQTADVPKPRSLDIALPRVGAYGRFVWPERGRARLAAELGADATLGNLRDATMDERQLPRLPRFGLSLSLGVEVAIL